MKSFVAMTVAATLVFAGAVPAVYAADKAPKTEQKISLDQVPAPVKATLEKEAKGGSIGDVSLETDAKGKTYYEAQIHTAKGKDRYVNVSETGKVLKRQSAKSEARERSKETTKTQ